MAAISPGRISTEAMEFPPELRVARCGAVRRSIEGSSFLQTGSTDLHAHERRLAEISRQNILLLSADMKGPPRQVSAGAVGAEK